MAVMLVQAMRRAKVVAASGFNTDRSHQRYVTTAVTTAKTASAGHHRNNPVAAGLNLVDPNCLVIPVNYDPFAFSTR
jgi:hypothetical protein